MAPSPSGTAYSSGQDIAQEQLGHVVSEIDTRGPAEQPQGAMDPSGGLRTAHGADTLGHDERDAGPTAPTASMNWAPSAGPPSSHYPHPGSRAQTQIQAQNQTPNVHGAGPPPLDEAQEFFQHELSQMVGSFPSRAEVARRQAADDGQPASSSSVSSFAMNRDGSGGDGGGYVGVPLSEGEKQAAKEEARRLAEGAGLPAPGAS